MKLNKLAAFVLTIAAAGSVYAQSPELTANIPFNFVFRGHTMPAGNYLIREIRTSGTIALQRVDEKETTIAIAVSVEPVVPQRSTTTLVFHQYGDQYFLSQVWGAYHSTFAPSSTERELAAGQKNTGKDVLVAVR